MCAGLRARKRRKLRGRTSAPRRHLGSTRTRSRPRPAATQLCPLRGKRLTLAWRAHKSTTCETRTCGLLRAGNGATAPACLLRVVHQRKRRVAKAEREQAPRLCLKCVTGCSTHYARVRSRVLLHALLCARCARAKAQHTCTDGQQENPAGSRTARGSVRWSACGVLRLLCPCLPHRLPLLLLRASTAVTDRRAAREREIQ